MKKALSLILLSTTIISLQAYDLSDLGRELEKRAPDIQREIGKRLPAITKWAKENIPADLQERAMKAAQMAQTLDQQYQLQSQAKMRFEEAKNQDNRVLMQQLKNEIQKHEGLIKQYSKEIDMVRALLRKYNVDPAAFGLGR